MWQTQRWKVNFHPLKLNLGSLIATDKFMLILNLQGTEYSFYLSQYPPRQHFNDVHNIFTPSSYTNGQEPLLLTDPKNCPFYF